MFRVVASAKQTRCLLSRFNIQNMPSIILSSNARGFQSREFTGFRDKNENALHEDEHRQLKLNELLDRYAHDPATQTRIQSAYLKGFGCRVAEGGGEQKLPKSAFRIVLEWSLFVLVGILVLDFCSEVAKEYQKIKSDRENKGGGPSKTSDGGSGKTDKVGTANKTGAIKSEKTKDSPGPIKNLAMQVDMEVKQTKPDEIKVRFSDVKGVDEAKEELQFIVDFLKNPDRFSRLGGSLPKGVLLVGNPGVGKTLLAKAVAGEAGVPFFYASGSEFDEVYVGMGARRMRQLFEAAKKAQPCVLFIDEIDSCGAKRISSQMHPFANHTVNQMLTEMDGFTKNSGVIVLGATNRRENLDDALLRPGRFDVEVTVPLPDVKGREDVLRLYLSRVKVGEGFDVKAVAKGTPGFSGSELENLVNQAAVHAAKERKPGISLADIEWAKDKLTMGPEKKGKIFDKETIKNTAFHEAGHTVVAYFTEGSNPIHKVTIIPRGQSLGHTAFLPSSESNQTKKQLLADLDVAMGGRIGEQILDKEQKINKGVSTGASSDFNNATKVATAMVKKYGMSPKVGVRVFDHEMAEVSNATKKLIDSEIKRLMDESYDRASKLLKTHSSVHKRLSEVLIEKETLTASEIQEILGPKKEVKVVEKEEEEKEKEEETEEKE